MIMTNTMLQFEINSLPKSIRNEVANFVEFLKTKTEPKPMLYKHSFFLGNCH